MSATPPDQYYALFDGLLSKLTPESGITSFSLRFLRPEEDNLRGCTKIRTQRTELDPDQNSLIYD